MHCNIHFPFENLLKRCKSLSDLHLFFYTFLGTNRFYPQQDALSLPLKIRFFISLYNSILLYQHLYCDYKNKKDSHSSSPFGFTQHGAKTGTNRFYPRPDALFPLKIQFFILTFLLKNSSTFFSNK